MKTFFYGELFFTACTYTVAAKDDGSRVASFTFTVDCFDYTAPGNVTNLAVIYDETTKKITATWNNPTDEDFAGLKLSWQKGGETYSEPVTLSKGTAIYTIVNVDGTASAYTILVKTYDLLGNESSGSYESVGISSEEPVYTILPPDTSGTAGTDATYILFGRWPQTIKAASVTVDKNTSEKKDVGMFTYYKGDDGEWYCEAQENAYKTEEQYKYSNGEQVKQKSATSYRWFKVEPIKWRVLTDDNGKKLLFAESGLMASVPYYDSLNARTINISGSDTTIYPNNYEHSRIRAWLNGIVYNKSGTNSDELNNKGFLHTAFTAEEQAKIAQTVVDNSKESTNPASNPNEWNNGVNDYACGNTTDKIFLLSVKEVTTSGYGFAKFNQYGAGNARIRKPTDFALANSALKNSDAAYGGWFFVRSPNYYYSARALYGRYDGLAYNSYPVNYLEGVVVPALCVE